MSLIEAANFDFGLESSRAMITALVPSLAKEALLAISEVPDIVSWDQANERSAVQREARAAIERSMSAVSQAQAKAADRAVTCPDARPK